MKETPIIFNGEMVRAIIDGRKTQTRRPVHKDLVKSIIGNGDNILYRNPFGNSGDQLWVRETFVQGWDVEPVTDCLMQFDDDGNELPKNTWYRATDSHIHWSDDDGWEVNVPWKPSIHMPRWASRITLEITGLRIERLQGISNADSIAEGIYAVRVFEEKRYAHEDGTSFLDAIDAYRDLWDSIYKNWDENPWVWVIEFKRIEA